MNPLKLTFGANYLGFLRCAKKKKGLLPIFLKTEAFTPVSKGVELPVQTSQSQNGPATLDIVDTCVILDT